MNVQERFVQNLRINALCSPGDRVLLAVSGGRDSVLMAHLFAEAGYPVGIAHCNFRLRGNDSDADEVFVSALADRLGIPFHTKAFDTAAYASQQGISIQMAARDLRYQWFEEIRAECGYDYIAIAQHQNDNTETVLLNLVRGTGLAGLGGIHPKRGCLIRPLLFLSGAEVGAQVEQLGLEYREDESNFSTKYARNKIRLAVVPVLKTLNPDLERTFTANISRFSAAYEVLQTYIDELRSQLFEQHNALEWHISIAGLTSRHANLFVWYELFRPFGFSETVLGDLMNVLPDGLPGKRFESNTHVLHLDRDKLILMAIETQARTAVFLETPGAEVQWHDYHFQSGLTTDTTVRAEPYMAQYDANRLIFPLQIRSWQPGDTFRPLGMNGNKKLSDLFVSLKIPRYRKKDVPVVVNGNGDIIWVAPYRISDCYKITDKTKKVFTLACR